MRSCFIGAAAFALVGLLGLFPQRACSQDVTKARSATGHINRIRLHENRFALERRGQPDLELQVRDGATLERQGRPARLADFVEGERVTVTYLPGAGMGQAVSMRDAPLSTADVRREVRRTFESARNYGYEKKAEYEKKLKRVLGDLNERTADLQEKAKEAGAAAQKRYQKELDELQQTRKVVEDKLERVRRATPGAWEEVKSGLRSAAVDLQKAFERARSRFEKEQNPAKPDPQKKD